MFDPELLLKLLQNLATKEETVEGFEGEGKSRLFQRMFLQKPVA